MSSRTIRTDAVGRREARPELATVVVTASGDGESAVDARATARDRALAIRESVTAVSEECLRTVTCRVEAASEFFEPDTDAPYLAEEKLHVDCTPERAEDVVVAVTEAGGTVQDVRFELHDAVRRELEDEALAAAMERAREKAERVAAAEGLAVSAVREVTTGNGDEGMQPIAEEALAGIPATDFRPDPIAVTATVEAVYELVER